MNVKESKIPIKVLYNDTINRMKEEEREQNKEPRPLTFCIRNNNQNGSKGRGKTIRFEIVGETEALNDAKDEVAIADTDKHMHEDYELHGLKNYSGNEIDGKSQGSEQKKKTNKFSLMIGNNQQSEESDN